TSVMFLDKTLEVRPDVPAVAFLLGSWWGQVRCLRSSPAPGTDPWSFARSGFLLGAALLCTQKVLFTLPASLLLWAGYALERPSGLSTRERLRYVVALGLGVLAPIAVILAVFAVQGGLHAFIRLNLLVNLRWPVRFSAEPQVR